MTKGKLRNFFKKILGSSKNLKTSNHKGISYHIDDILSLRDNDIYNTSYNSNYVVNDYKSNVIVHRCINLIASAGSGINWNIFTIQNREKKLDNNHIIHHLLQKPNFSQSGIDFLNELISNYLLFGHVYILARGNPNEKYENFSLEIISDNEIKYIICEKTKHIRSYIYKDKYYNIDPIEGFGYIMQIKNYNPSDKYKGLSSISAAFKSIDLHNKVSNWNKALLKNTTRPSGALTFENGDGYLTDEQFLRLKEQFYENFTGAHNSGKPLILEGGLKWQEAQNTQKLEKFIELKDSTARDIAIAFNVPPQLLGINGDNTYSNMQEARLALWEENILPLLSKISDGLSNWLSFLYKEKIILEVERDSIPTLTRRRENLWPKLEAANFLTINEKRKIIGLADIKNCDELKLL